MYTFHVAERLGMSRRQFLEEHDSADISELMAFDRLKDEDYRKRLESEAMTDEERNAAIMKMFKG